MVRRTALAATALACGDALTGPHVLPPALAPSTRLVARVACVADTRSLQVACAATDSSALAPAVARDAGTGGALADLIVGGQGTFINLVSSSVTYSGDVFSFNTTVQNLIGQKLGTTDGTTLDATGVRVFFEDLPTATSGSGTLDFINPVGGGSLVDGVATFTRSNQPYYQYSQVLSTGQVSSARNWRIHIPATVSTFAFAVYVSAPVQFPTGWIDLSPASATLKTAATQALTPTVRDVVGRSLSGQAVTWVTSAAGVATVNSSGVVTAVADGSATITATSTTRTGTAAITVSTAAGSTTTITGSPNPLPTGATSTITVQARNAASTNMTAGADSVVLSASTGTLGSVTDNNNGTYTALLTSGAVGTVNVTGTINGATIGTPAAVVFTGPSSVAINAGDGQTAASGAAVGTAPSVIVRDQQGNPVSGATVTFSVTGGGGSATAATTTTSAGGIATVGSWTLGSGGAGCSASAITSCTRNTLHAAVTGGSSPSLDFKAFVPPIVPATAAYQAVGNATLTVASGIGLLQNAFSINGNGANGTGASLSVTTLAPAGSLSGTATIASAGSFSYLSAPATVNQTETFTFTVTDGIAATNTSATLSVNVPQHVWYVQPGFAGTSTGADSKPWKDFSATAGAGVQSVAVAGDTILVLTGSGTATGGTLKAGQKVYGQGSTTAATFTTGSAATFRNGATVQTLLAAGSSGTSPSLGAITLAASDTLRGLALAGTLTGSSFGTLRVTETILGTGASKALDLATGTLSGSFTSITSTGGTNNVLLTSVSTSGTASLGSGALSGATSDAFKVSGGAGTFTYSGTIANTATLAVNIASMTGGGVTLSGNINTNASRGTGISVASNSGGTVTFSGAQIGLSTGTGAGVSLTSNTGATISFTPATGLQVATTSGTAFLATGGGTVSVTGSGNTLSATTTGTALNVTSTGIGASGLTFQSITTAGGGSNGIFLKATGSAGGLTVAGVSGVCTRTTTTCNGGTIAGTLGSDGATAGVGVYLDSTASVSLSRLRINGTHQNYGIYGRSVAGLTLANVLMDGTYGTNSASEGTVGFDELSGSASVANSYFAGGVLHNFRIHNAASGTTLNRITFDTDTIGFTNTAAASGDGIHVAVDLGTTNVTVQNSGFIGAYAVGAQFLVNGGTADIAFNTNRMTNTQSNTNAAYLHFALVVDGSNSSTGNVTYAIGSNVMNGSKQAPVYIAKRHGQWTLTGSITSNTIGNAGSNSGSVSGEGIRIEHTSQGKHKVLIDQNTIGQVNNIAGISMRFVGNAFGSTNNGSLHATVRRNTINSPGTTAGIVDGVHFLPAGSTGDSYTTCVNFGNGSGNANSIVNGGNAANGGAPYSVGPVTPTGVAGFFKLLGLSGGPFTGHAGESPIDTRVSADNGISTGLGFLDLSTGLTTTVSTNGALGVACDLF